MISFLIYAAHVAKGSFWVAIIFIVICFVNGLSCANDKDKGINVAYAEKQMRESSTWIFFLVIFCVLIPSEKTIYLMVAAHIAGKTDIPSNLVKVIENKLGDMVSEIKAKK